MMRVVFFALLVILETAAPRVFAADDCVHRLEADIYYNALLATIKSNAIGAAEMSAVAASDVPLNPLASAPPTSKTSAAKSLFAALSADASVRARWAVTKERLQQWLAQNATVNAERLRAKSETRGVIAPDVIKEFPAIVGSFAMTRLENDLLVSYISTSFELKVIRLSDGEQLLSAEIDRYDVYLTAMSRENDGSLSVYVVASDNVRLENTALFKADLVNKRLEPYVIDRELPALVPSKLHAFSPDLLVIEAASNPQDHRHQWFNIANHRRSDLTKWMALKAPTPTPPPAGLLLGRTKNFDERPRDLDILVNDGYYTQVFVTPRGRAFEFFVSGGNILARETGDADFRTFRFPRTNGHARAIAVTETPDGRVLIGSTQSSQEKGAFYIFDYDKGPKPKIEIPLANWGYKPPHFFYDPQAHLYAAVPGFLRGSSSLAIFSVEDGQQVSEQTLPNQIEQWFDLGGGENYFPISKKDKLYLYRTFSKPGQ